MKKIFCELNIFDLEQKVYVIDDETGERDIVAIAMVEELPAAISALSSENQIPNVVLSGNFTYSSLISENIIAYSKLNYNNNEIKVEVLK